METQKNKSIFWLINILILVFFGYKFLTYKVSRPPVTQPTPVSSTQDLPPSEFEHVNMTAPTQTPSVGHEQDEMAILKTIAETCRSGNLEQCSEGTYLARKLRQPAIENEMMRYTCLRSKGDFEECLTIGAAMKDTELAVSREKCKAGEFRYCLIGAGWFRAKGDLRQSYELLAKACYGGEYAACISIGDSIEGAGLNALESKCNQKNKSACFIVAKAKFKSGMKSEAIRILLPYSKEQDVVAISTLGGMVEGPLLKQ